MVQMCIIKWECVCAARASGRAPVDGDAVRAFQHLAIIMFAHVRAIQTLRRPLCGSLLCVPFSIRTSIVLTYIIIFDFIGVFCSAVFPGPPPAARR